MLIGHLWSVSTALELVCHSLLAIASHKNARERAIVGMQQGPLFAGLTGKVSEACVLAAHSQWIKRLDPGPFLNLMKNNRYILVVMQYSDCIGRLQYNN